MERCATCKWWDDLDELPEMDEILEGRGLCHIQSERAAIGYTCPDFGCILWEASESDHD